MPGAPRDTAAGHNDTPARIRRRRPKPRAMRRRARSAAGERHAGQTTPPRAGPRRRRHQQPRRSTRRLRTSRPIGARGSLPRSRCVTPEHRWPHYRGHHYRPTDHRRAASLRNLLVSRPRYCPGPERKRRSNPAPLPGGSGLLSFCGPSYFETVCTTLETGRVLAFAPVSFISFASASSYSGNVASCVLALICTTL